MLYKGDYTFYLGTVDSTVYGSHSWAYATPKDSKEITSNNGANSVTYKQNGAIRSTIIYNKDNNGPRESEKFAHNALLQTVLRDEWDSSRYSY